VTKVLVLGAGGQIARWVISELAGDEHIELTLFLRDATKIVGRAGGHARVLQGDVLNRAQLDAALVGQNIVYANLAGDDLDAQAQAVVSAMKAAHIQRLVFACSLGIYDEVPGKFGDWNRREIGAYLPPFRRAADVVEDSGMDYTLLRPAWLSDADEVDYETTEKGQPFRGTEVSRKSVAALITQIIRHPNLHSHANLGVNKPNTDGDKPSFY
jgi:uncharacterized protein YbjT (DUF2867 family)